jgi:AcrR family transcriptional regulator
MRSAPSAQSLTDDDRTARARIRDAAISRFAEEGVATASVRGIAQDAGVSAALVIHHFGSKEALRAACDAHVAAVIRRGKQAALAAGPTLDPLAAIRQADTGPPVIRYLARTMIDGSPQVAGLIDDLVADAENYLATGEAAGSLRPTRDRRARAALLLVWSLGALVLHEHVHRLLGVDLMGSVAELARPNPYLTSVLEIYADGLLTPEASDRYWAALAAAEEEERS